MKHLNRTVSNIPYTGKLLWLVHKMTIHGKTVMVHQAVAIMYCTKQGENFCDRLKNAKVFPNTVDIDQLIYKNYKT